MKKKDGVDVGNYRRIEVQASSRTGFASWGVLWCSEESFCERSFWQVTDADGRSYECRSYEVVEKIVPSLQPSPGYKGHTPDPGSPQP